MAKTKVKKKSAITGKLKPVTIWGIEFDALVDETKALNSTIPMYPVEKGFPLSDTIINDPITLDMTLYISDSPVSYRGRKGHTPERGRSEKICKKIEEAWEQKKLAKIVTSRAIYKDMGITSISIKNSSDTGYAREVTITARKVRITNRRTVNIPAYILKAGKTKAKAGKASTSNKSKKTGSTSTTSTTKTKTATKKTVKKTKQSDPKKKQSILYKAAKGMKFI